MNDQKIIELFWERHESAISVTAEKYGKYCHTIAYNILFNHFDAEECVNDTYLGAWNSIPPQKPGNLTAFLGKIVRNLASIAISGNRLQSAGTDRWKSFCPSLKTVFPT